MLHHTDPHTCCCYTAVGPCVLPPSLPGLSRPTCLSEDTSHVLFPPPRKLHGPLPFIPALCSAQYRVSRGKDIKPHIEGPIYSQMDVVSSQFPSSFD